MLRTVLQLFSASMLCVSCGDASIAPSQSLVGAEKLPAATELARETFYIARGGGAYGGDALTYEWRPDNSLLVTHTFSDGQGTGEVVRGKETLRIAPIVAAEVRQLLSRVRPAKLEGVEQDARPIGCERQGPHDFGEVTVGFVNEGDARATEYDQVGIFALPTADSCNTSAAVEARAIVRRALQLLPRSKVASNYERAT
ncbi:MAG: hypothetical protein LH466_10490 [Sphingomonas bacterium]|nr:hypothetical protein [Sphingomonas bacterium]